MTAGQQIVQRLHEGSLVISPSAQVEETRGKICESLCEIINVGARIRPLLVGTEKLGWVRGVHMSERRSLRHWVYTPTDFIEQIIKLGTTLGDDEIAALSLMEMRSLTRVIHAMSASDLKLAAYLQAFTTTSASEHLWHSKGQAATAFTDKKIILPDGRFMVVHTPSDHATTWASLCHQRIQSKLRIDASQNAVLTIRPWVGKGADSLSDQLQISARALLTDSLEPWGDIIKTESADVNDGWAHAEDNSVEGMRRELHGWFKKDRHEQVFDTYAEQNIARAETQRREAAKRAESRRIETTKPRRMTPISPEKVHTELREDRRKRAAIPKQSAETQSSLADRLAKYR